MVVWSHLKPFQFTNGRTPPNKRPTVTVKCFSCGVEKDVRAYRVETTKSGIFFCNKACQDAPVARDKGYASGPRSANVNRVPPYRTRAIQHYGAVCCICGYTGPVIEVDHIDGNRRHNKIVNLQVLCATHHCEKTFMGQEYILSQKKCSCGQTG